MIEKLVNSKTRIKLLKLFFSHIDDRYYLRELERLLDESLSPLRRQLIKLTGMGILITEEEANLKYYMLNKNFEGLEELKRLVLDREVLDSATTQLHSNNILRVSEANREETTPAAPRSNDIYVGDGLKPSPTVSKQFRYDLAFLSFISVFVLATAIFVVYANNKNIKQVVNLVSEENNSTHGVAVRRLRESNAGNGEMMSKKWKFMPGNVPVFSSGETSEEKKSKEL